MKYLYTALFFLASISAMSQDFNQYKTLESRWVIPSDFTERSSTKYYKEIASISQKDKSGTKKSKKDFYLESNFHIDEFLVSGKVQFNDEVSVYLGRVLDELLKNDKTLRDKVRVYAVKSPVVNAFATNNGIIFINLGLMARLENEAQLAFILAHEVIHFREQHNINSYVKNIEIEKGKGDYRKFSLDERAYARSSYSKEQELAADTEGLTIFLNSSYASTSINQVFDILKLADLPIGNKVFKKSFFESGQYVFPKETVLDTARVFAANEKETYDDSKSTHPNIAKRKEGIASRLQNNAADKSKTFLVSESEFAKIKDIAQFELCREHLLSTNYMEALYLAYTLLDRYPQSEYLHKTIGKALYGITKYGMSYYPKDYYGEFQRLVHFFDEQSSLEHATLTIKWLYTLHEQNKQDEEVKLMLDDIVADWAIRDKNLEKRYQKFDIAPTATDTKKEAEYIRFAFNGFKNEAEFFTYLEQHSRNARKLHEQNRLAKKRAKKKKKAPLNVEKVVVIEPIYKKIDTRKRKSVRYEDAEEVKIGLDEKVKMAAEKLDMQAEVINTKNLRSTEVAIFNQHCLIQDWLREKLKHPDPNGISPIHNEIQDLAKSFGTNYFSWMGGVSLTSRNSNMLSYFLVAIMIPPITPICLYAMFKPEKNTLFFSFTFDVQKEQLMLSDVRTIRMKDNNTHLKSNIYYTLFRLKN